MDDNNLKLHQIDGVNLGPRLILTQLGLPLSGSPTGAKRKIDGFATLRNMDKSSDKSTRKC